MSPSLANFVVEMVNFLLLAGGLGWLLFKPVRRALAAEQQRLESQRAEADRLRAEAEKLERAAQARHEATEREVTKVRSELLATARHEALTLLEQARAARATERHAFDDEVQREREAGAAALAETVGRIAAESVSRLLETIGGPSLDVALVRAACAELRSLPGEARERAVVECAHSLPAEARSLLRDVLGDRFAERTVDGLQAGVRVTTPSGQVDATLASIARETERTVRRLALGESEATAHG